MLVVLANRHDQNARRLAEHWAPLGAGVITSKDLSAPGWRYHPGSLDASTAVISGQIVRCKDITALLTRIPCVCGVELVDIRPEDREYVAAEMTAFLTAWLSSLPCPVLNRPTATCLSGPGWRPEQWLWAAARLGIPVQTRHRQAVRGLMYESGDPGAGTVGVTVVGDRWFGPVDRVLAAQANKLAMTAGVELLGVRFSDCNAGSLLVSANPWPDLSFPVVADAVAEYLLRHPPSPTL